MSGSAISTLLCPSGVYARLSVSATFIVFPGEYSRTKLYFCNRRKRRCMRGGQDVMLLENIVFEACDHSEQ